MPRALLALLLLVATSPALATWTTNGPLGGRINAIAIDPAIPSRVYTAGHLDYVAECAARVFQRREDVRGFRLVNNPPYLRHFTAELAAV